VTKVTLELPDDLAPEIQKARDRLPELLALSLKQSPVPAHVYRHILDFLATDPSPEAIAAFRPTQEMRERLETLLKRSRTGEITPVEEAELDEMERIEHFVVTLKAGNLAFLSRQR